MTPALDLVEQFYNSLRPKHAWEELDKIELPQTTIEDEVGLPKESKLGDGTVIFPSPSQVGNKLDIEDEVLGLHPITMRPLTKVGWVVWDGAADVETSRSERRLAMENLKREEEERARRLAKGPKGRNREGGERQAA